MIFDENVLYKDNEKKESETMKQVRVDVELHKNSPNDVVAKTHEILKTVVKELEQEPVIFEQVLRRLSRKVRELERYSSSLHYLLLTDQGELASFDKVGVI